VVVPSGALTVYNGPSHRDTTLRYRRWLALEGMHLKPVCVTKDIAAPVKRVYAVFTDVEQAAELVKGINKVELLSKGSFAVGTRWKETRVMFGREASEIMEVTACDPPHGFVTEAESHGMRYRAQWRFDPLSDGTRVTLEFSGIPLSRFAKLASPVSGLMSGGIATLIKQDMEDMAAAAEQTDRA